MIVGIDLNRFTPTEQRVLRILFDGQMHPAADLSKEALQDELATVPQLRNHINNIRKKLNGTGLLLNFVHKGGSRRKDKGYQLSRRLHSDE